MNPNHYPRRVLLCVAGMTPQVITETLYALAVDAPSGKRFIPTEIRVITTVSGREQVRLSLLAHDQNRFGQLCKEYGLPEIHFTEASIDVIRSAGGEPLADLVTPEDNECAANHLTRLVHELASDKQCAIHASIAGGRKTMGFYLGYAMSLFGREQDRISHVLVTPGFESHKGFYYKPREPVTLQDDKGRAMSTESAAIHLAEIPFIPLSSSVPQTMLDGQKSFSEAVEHARLALGKGAMLQVAPMARQRHRAIAIGEVPVKLTPVQLAIYVWFATRRSRDPDERGVARSAFGHASDSNKGKVVWGDLIGSTRRAFGRLSREALALESTAERYTMASGNDPLKWLGPNITKINATLSNSLPQVLARDFFIHSEEHEGETWYRLKVSADRIEWVESEPNT